MARSHPAVLTVEEGQISNGFGAFMAREIDALELASPPRVAALGIPDEFIEHGARAGLLAEIGLDPAGIAERVRRLTRRTAELEPA
jgi:1-deoxy-D-xylulose-5-phosphate synthase